MRAAGAKLEEIGRAVGKKRRVLNYWLAAMREEIAKRIHGAHL